MNSFQRNFLNIIRASLTDECMQVCGDFALQEGCTMAHRHSVEAMFYYGAVSCGISAADPAMRKLFTLTCQHITVSEKQNRAISAIFRAFDEKKIEYMPLKGILMKDVYPKPEMRTMGDGDILIKLEQYPAIKPIMQELGFEESLENDHELSWIKYPTHIELHKRIMPSYNKDYYAYFGDGWRLAKKVQGTRYFMTGEDQFVYQFTHFAKHYREAGIGIKHMTDLWLFRKAYSALDWQYICNELKTLRLYEFYKNIMQTIDVWFDGACETELTDFITEFIFNSGVYGKNETRSAAEVLFITEGRAKKKSVKTKKLLQTMFLPYQYMCIIYPVLKEHAYLLPVLWVVRLVNAVFCSRRRIKEKLQEIESLDIERANEHQKALNFVGLDFNFKE